GSCGTAVYRRQPVIVADIATDPLWEEYRHLAAPHELRACWSVPIIASRGAVLGAFAAYSREARAPLPDEIDWLEYATRLAAVAVEHQLTELEAHEQRIEL